MLARLAQYSACSAYGFLATRFHLFLLFSAFSAFVRAQDQAHCDPSAGFDWAVNSLGQDPCDVASRIGGVCNGGTAFPIPPLPSGKVYTGPPITQRQNTCLCSSVYYSLLSACASCQNRNFDRWSFYNQNCTTVYLQVQIPPDTKVPHWAYDNVTIYDGFNATVAKADSTFPESSAAATPTTTQSSVPSHKPNAGAIAGGVIGGVVFFVLIIAAIVFFIRRRRSGQTPSNRDATSPTFRGSSPLYPSSTPKLYDPSDPSTFPPSPAVTGSLYTSTDQSLGTRPNRTYTGAAEV